MNRHTFNAENIKVVVLDCDGVMFDTENSNKIYYNTILEHFNKPELTEEQFAYIHMCTVNEAIPYLFPEENIQEEAMEYAKEQSYKPLFEHMVIEPFLKPLLKKLRVRFRTAIATNRSRTMQGVLKAFNLTGSFDIVVTSLDVKNPKPHPDQLNKIINFFKISPYELIYIGDSKTDEEAAKSSGINFISYKNKELSADFYISSLNEVEKILNIN